MKNNLGCFASAVLSLAATPHAMAAEPLEAQILQVVKCNAKSSIWLQDASFSAQQLKVEKAGGTLSFSLDLITTYGGSGKQEKSSLKGTASEGTPPKLLSLQQTDDDGPRDLNPACSGG